MQQLPHPWQVGSQLHRMMQQPVMSLPINVRWFFTPHSGIVPHGYSMISFCVCTVRPSEGNLLQVINQRQAIHKKHIPWVLLYRQRLPNPQ